MSNELKTMDQCTHEVRTEYWKGIIQACSQRPAGQSAKDWMKGNDINERSYYHWQRKFRCQAYELMKEDTVALPVPAQKEAVSFVEIPCLPLQPNIQKVTDDGTAVALIRTSSLIIELINDISNGIIAAILKKLSYT